MTSPRSGSRVGMCRIWRLFSAGSAGGSRLVAEANIYGRKVVTYNLHLESRGADELRVRQLNEVLADSRRYVDRPRFVVAGDFNLDAGAGDAARALGDAGFHDAVRIARASDHSRARPVARDARSTGSLSPIRRIPEARCTMKFAPRTTIRSRPRLCNPAQPRDRRADPPFPRLFQVGGYLCHRRTANASRIAEALSCASCDPPDISIGRLASVCGAVVGHALACRQRWTVVKPPE